MKTDCVKINLWTYVRTNVEYEVLPYLLSKWNCTDICEWDKISITYRRSHTFVWEWYLDRRRYCPPRYCTITMNGHTQLYEFVIHFVGRVTPIPTNWIQIEKV